MCGDQDLDGQTANQYVIVNLSTLRSHFFFGIEFQRCDHNYDEQRESDRAIDMIKSILHQFRAALRDRFPDANLSAL